MKRIAALVLVTSISLLLASGPALATRIITVRQDGAGDFTSINEALDAVPALLTEPTIIEIRDPAVYYETVRIDKTTSAENPLMLRSNVSAKSGTPKSGTPLVVVQDTYAAAISIYCDYVTVECIRAQGGDRSHAISVKGRHNVISFCEAFGAYNQDSAGICLDEAGDNRLAKNRIHDNQNGIRIYDYGSHNNIIENNVIYDNDYRGIWIYRTCTGNLATNNVLYNNGMEIHLGHGGEHYDPSGDNRFRNNILYARPGGYGFVVDRHGDPGTLPAGTVIDFNNIYAPGAIAGYIDGRGFITFAEWQAGSGQSAHGISADPLFVNPENGEFDLQSIEGGYPADSPCIDAGIALETPFCDYYGIERPLGSAHDMGAYEHDAIPIEPDVAVSFKITGITDPFLAGSSSDLTITAINDAGDVAYGYTGTIRFSSTDPLAGLPPDFTFSGGEGGVQVFQAGLTLRKPGEQAVKVSEMGYDAGEVMGIRNHITVSETAIGKHTIRQDGRGDFVSIQDAVDAMPPLLDKSYLLEIQDDGSYWESAVISKNTYPDRSITLRAQEGRTPTIVARNSYSAAVVIDSDRVTLQDLRTRGGDRANGICISPGASHNLIEGCHAFGTTNQGFAGIYIHDASDNEVNGNFVYNNQRGITVYDYGGDRNRILNNVVHDNLYQGIFIYRSTEGNLVANNTLYHNNPGIQLGGGGEYYDCGSGNRIMNNIVQPSPGGACILSANYGFPGVLPAGTELESNLYFAPDAMVGQIDGVFYTTLAEWQAETGQDAVSLYGDPLFVDGGADFHLLGTSPAIDAGSDVPEVTRDMDGDIRPKGAAYDIGAYETGMGPGTCFIGAATSFTP